MDDSGQSADHEAKDTAENDKGASGIRIFKKFTSERQEVGRSG